jgi:hypothetical protein
MGMDASQSSRKKERDHLEGTGAEDRYTACDEITYEGVLRII